MRFKIPPRFHAIDPHNHLWFDAHGKLDVDYMNGVLTNADCYGIERLGISCPLTDAPFIPAERFRRANDLILEAVALYPNRFFGFCFVDPADPGAMAEIDRCVATGMVGIKLYHQHLICEEIQRPIMARAAHYGIPVLMHAGRCTDPGTIAEQPRLSNSAHFLQALKMFPETILIQAHIGGGGDWEWNLRVLNGLRNPRFFIDLGGSVCDADIVRRTIEAVGIDSVLFATDMSFPEAVVKTFAAGLSEEDLQKVLHDNWIRIEEMRE